MAERRVASPSQPGAGAGVVGARESDGDHRLGPGAQTDGVGIISRIVLGFTGPSGVIDLAIYDMHSMEFFILRRYWELAGGPRVILLKGGLGVSGGVFTPGYFMDPHTSGYLCSVESFPCDAKSRNKLVAHFRWLWTHSYSATTVTFRHFKLPLLDIEFARRNEHPSTDTAKDVNWLDDYRAGLQRCDELAEMWDKAELTLGRDAAPPARLAV